jgi:hypothetical protein
MSTVTDPVVPDSTAAVPGAASAGSTVDMASVLAKIHALEREKMDMKAALDMASNRLGKLQEGKRAEMEAMMNSTILKWIEQLDTKDGASKENLLTGLNSLVKDGNESGVWEVVACASSNWAANVNKIEAQAEEINSYKEKEKQFNGGLFATDTSRIEQVGEKRRHEEMAPDTHANPADIWGEFQTMIMSSGGNRGHDYSNDTAPPIDIRSLR